MNEIGPEVALSEFGIDTLHETMPNGEKRFRLRRDTGDGYVLTVSGDHGAWQSSHYHEHISEYYLVEREWIAIASINPVKHALEIEFIREGATFCVAPNVPHNVYLPSGAIVHTIKMNSQIPSDWIPAPELDELTKKICEAELMEVSHF